MAMKSIQEISRNGVITAYRAYFRYKGKVYTKQYQQRELAEEWLITERQRIREKEGEPQPLMFSTGVNEYLCDCALRQRPSSTKEKQTYYRGFAKFMTKDFVMGEVTSIQCREFLNQTAKVRGNKAANRRHRALQALWTWLREYLIENPWKRIKQFAEEDFIKYVPPYDDVVTVLKHAEQWQKHILLFILATGARIGEVLNLKWSDVADDCVRLWTRKRKNGALQARNIAISHALRDVLETQRPLTYGRDYVFINPETYMPYRTKQPSIKFMMKRLCNAAEVKPFGFHALRHFVASQLVRSGQADLTDIQRLLGHQKATTTDIYLKSIAPNLRHMAELIDTAVMAPADR